MENIFPLNLAHQILKPPLPLLGSAEDMLIWKYSNNGEYTIKSAYAFLRRSNIAGPSSSANIWKLLWSFTLSQVIPPRVILFLWKSLRNMIPTNSSVARRIPTVDSSCCTYLVEVEDVEHLLFKCPAARAV